MKRKLVCWKVLIIVGMGIIGGSVMAYPYVSSFLNGIQQSQAISGYLSEADNESKQAQDALIQEARDYNDALRELTTGTDAMTAQSVAQALEAYDSILNINDTGMMGFIDIPSIHVHLPIYHGTDSYSLQQGVGHMEMTSFPVGGEGTHAVLSAHSGLPQSTLFTNLDEVEVGDTFYITVLSEEFWYEVYEIETVLPEEVEKLGITLGEDLCTLITCTPYGINTHRLLVHGQRIDAPVEEVEEVLEETAVQEDTGTPVWVLILAVLGMTILGLAIALVVIAIMTRRPPYIEKRLQEEEQK